MSWEKESKINSRYEGTFPPLFSPKGRPLCDTSVLHREIPDPKQRCAEVLTPSLAGTALPLCSCVCWALHCLEAALGPCPMGGAWSSPSLCFPARCVLLLPVTLHRPSAYSHLYLRRDVEGSGLHLFPCFLVPLYYKMLVFNNSVFYYVLFHWETQKTNPKLQRTWN